MAISVGWLLSQKRSFRIFVSKPSYCVNWAVTHSIFPCVCDLGSLGFNSILFVMSVRKMTHVCCLCLPSDVSFNKNKFIPKVVYH